METGLTLRPGQNGTKKLVERYGERLVRVRYLYDALTFRRLKTVELIVESVAIYPYRFASTNGCLYDPAMSTKQ